MNNSKNILLLGAPGSGKGTQAKLLETELNYQRIDTGSLIRQAISEKTDLGLQALDYVNAGKLVPDELIIAMVISHAKNIQDNGGKILLDGFPRNIKQAEALVENNIVLNKVININIPFDKLTKRIVGRRLCTNKSCGAVYHVDFQPSKVIDICDICHSPLMQRNDDREELVNARIETYMTETKPLNEYYEKANILINIDGDKEVTHIFEDIKNSL